MIHRSLGVAWLMAVPVAHAAAPFDMMEISRNSHRQVQAEAALAGDCNAAETRLRVPRLGKPEQQDTLIITRESWTGTCVQGQADGEGTLTMRARMADGSDLVALPSLSRTSGRMLRGKKIGPWQIHAHVTKYAPSGSWIDGLYRWDDALYQGMYARGADGAYTAVEYDAGTKAAKARAGVPVIGAALAAQLVEARIDAADGRPSRGSDLKLPVPMLADLLPGALAAKSPGPGLRSLRTKKVAIVLSAATIASLRQVDDYQARLKAYAARQSSQEVRDGLLGLAQEPDKAAIAREVARALRLHFAAVTQATDLHAFLEGDADYAIVIDFHFEHQVAALLKDFDAILGGDDIAITVTTPSRTSGYFYFAVLDRRLDVVAAQLASGRHYVGVQAYGDRSYLPSALALQRGTMTLSYGRAQPGTDTSLSLLGVTLWHALLPSED